MIMKIPFDFHDHKQGPDGTGTRGGPVRHGRVAYGKGI